jgi:hypothetical protein
VDPGFRPRLPELAAYRIPAGRHPGVRLWLATLDPPSQPPPRWGEEVK